MSDKVSLGAVVDKPGSSSSNKTGSWRTFKPLVTDKCIGCGMCVWYCPEGCIEIKEKNGKKRAVIDYDYCKGCLICIGQCSVKAIESEREKK
ncbi:MAG: 4Fe-4S binding protein [Deltaproteobacteria bacterium]|nr:4Fe-4S binding protein [Deltaproteobacteria bacterium]